MKEIILTQGKVTQVSDHRFDYLNQWTWCASKSNNGKRWYAYRIDGKRPNRKMISMHRQIMEFPKNMEVDHKDRNGLNNQDNNLRICTPIENNRNKKLSSSNTSGYKGVTWEKDRQKYVSQISINRKHIFLGRFIDPVDAARRYDEAAKKYFGEFAVLNFSNEN